MDGILNIDKPWGKTSYSIVALVKRLTGERRVGHAGTLDPAATGVLPVCLGQGTRVVEYLMDTTKAYLAQLELGIATDTYDAAGRITRQTDPSAINRQQVETALDSFRGLIMQTPPMYSAVKYQGKPLYKLARAGITVERRSRPVEIHQLEMKEWQPPLVTIEVVCSKGTYIRTLAHDLGQVLGCGAALKSLLRSRCGLFHIDDAISVAQLEQACQYGYWRQFVYPLDSVLCHWKAMIVSDEQEKTVRNGRPLVLEEDNGGNNIPAELSSEDLCRVYNPDGCLLGILRFNSVERQWQPEKIFL